MLPHGAWKGDAAEPTKLLKGQKGLVQAMYEPSPCPEHRGKGDPLSELINQLYGTAACSRLVAGLCDNHLYEDNHGGRRKSSTEAVSRRAPSTTGWVLPGCLQSLPAGSLPSCRQRAHHTTVMGGSTALCVCLSRDASCSSAAQEGGSPMLPCPARGISG